MQVNDLKNEEKKERKRVGRGGKRGTYSGRGMNGQKSRSGFSQRATFEGGASSIVTRTKKNKGFKSLSVRTEVVNLGRLDEIFADGEKVDKKSLKEKNIIKSLKSKVKILSVGDLTKKIIVGVDVLTSKVAKDKIEKAGGKIETAEVK